MPIKERRKFMRITTELKAEYWAKGPSMASGQARICDFSREGIGVRLAQPVGQGEFVDLTVKVPGDNVPILATGTVAWVRSNERGSSSGAGLRFHSINPLDLARMLNFVYSRWLGDVKQRL